MSLLDWKVHGPLGAAVVAIAYLGRKHLQRDAKQFEKIDERVRYVEINHMVKADGQRIEDKVDEVLKILASRR